jgi:DNA-binding response OmpR family regulator
LKFEEAANNFGVIVRRDIRLATLQYLLILSQIDNNEEALYSQNSKRRILVVDNETDITITLQVGLEDGGFDVDVFNDPDLALKRFKPNFYDLVLIDIMMPKIDGFELYERLRKIDPDIKVCFLTASEAYHEEFRKAEHCSLNKDLFLQKPISTDDLIMEVSKKLDSHNNG